MQYEHELKETVQQIAAQGKGILAADESNRTIKKRLEAVNVESTEDTRQRYRELLFTTPRLGEFISGIIMYEETLYQKTQDGTPFPEYIKAQGSIPGIKVDKGTVPLAPLNEEKTTQGLDGLEDRLADYKQQGARFAKWRCVYSIDGKKPSMQLILTNAQVLARYAAICQSQGIVPIVEPEVLIDGDHSLERCKEVTARVLKQVFNALNTHKVLLEGIILKPNMVIEGKDHKTKQPQAVAEATIETLKRYVPAAVPSINFLSGGQTPEEATLHLDLMNKLGPLPWNVSFSYARALQDYCLKAWQGKPENTQAAQDAFLKRMQLNSAAAMGQYATEMED